MAKLALLLIGVAGPAGAAEPITAEMAMERYRETFEPIAAIDCPKPSTADEIVVCGRPDAPDPDRLPLPVAPVPGQRIRGEPVSAVVAMGKRETCSTVGPNQQCGGGLPIIPVAVTAAKIAIKLIKGRD